MCVCACVCVFYVCEREIKAYSLNLLMKFGEIWLEGWEGKLSN